jgi:hypothetical protein
VVERDVVEVARRPVRDQAHFALEDLLRVVEAVEDAHAVDEYGSVSRRQLQRH